MIRILDDCEVDVHIKNYEAEEARLEAEKKKEADKKKAAGIDFSKNVSLK